MGTIAKITAGGATHLIASTVYGICSTAAATAAKTVNFTDDQAFTLIQGETIHVRFTNTNTASNPTLNVKGTGAKPIYRIGTTRPGTTVADSWAAGEIVSFTYDTTATSTGAWIMNAGHKYSASTTTITPISNLETYSASTLSDNKLSSNGTTTYDHLTGLPVDTSQGSDPNDITKTDYKLDLGGVINGLSATAQTAATISGLTSAGQTVVTGISAS